MITSHLVIIRIDIVREMGQRSIMMIYGQFHHVIMSKRFGYRIGCVSTRFGLLRALGYYAQHNCDFVLPLITRFGL